MISELKLNKLTRRLLISLLPLLLILPLQSCGGSVDLNRKEMTFDEFFEGFVSLYVNKDAERALILKKNFPAHYSEMCKLLAKKMVDPALSKDEQVLMTMIYFWAETLK